MGTARRDPGLDIRLRLRVAADAERQIRDAATWWERNRPAAPGLFRRELTRVLELITTQPGVGASARLTIVGLTPGWQQTRVAISRFLQCREQGCSIDEAQRHAKAEASFAGSMRANLVAMLDDLGLADALNVASCTDLFDSARGLLHTTSALRYPVFFKGRNYSGTPRPTRIRVLRRLIDEVLAPELGCVSNSLIIPLGKATSECLEYVSAAGRLARGRWLSGFPHPSGLNGHRVRTFRAN